MRLRLLTFLVALVTVSTALARPRVVTTNTIVHDLVLGVGGDDIEAVCLLPVGTDPHVFSPSPAQVRVVAGADLVVMNGLGFEAWIEKLVRNSGYRGPLVAAARRVDVIEGACEDHGHDGHDHGHADPHAWHDARHIPLYVNEIQEALARLVPAAAGTFSARADALRTQWTDLHAYAVERLSAVPESRRKLVTSHDSLRYFARAYGFEVLPISGVSTDDEPSAREIAGLVRTVRAAGVSAAFFDNTVNPKVTSAIAADAGIRVVASLYTDSVGEPGSTGATLAGMFKANVDTIADALR